MKYSILIVPLMLIIVGFVMYKRPPKKINWIIGYRTRKSMRDKKKWKKANQYCGKLWIIIGFLTTIISCLLLMLDYFKILGLSETIITSTLLIQLIPLILSIFIVENKIK